MPAALRRLGLFSASSLVIANMIGAGVFTTSGFALADLGDPGLVLVAWGVGGVLAMCGALSYGAFARRLPDVSHLTRGGRSNDLTLVRLVA